MSDRVYQPNASMGFDTTMYDRAVVASRAAEQQTNSIQIGDKFRQIFLSGFWSLDDVTASDKSQKNTSGVEKSARNVVGGAALFWLAASPSSHATLPNTFLSCEREIVATSMESHRGIVPWDTLDGKLTVWMGLPSDWDGEDGVPPSPDTVAAARNFLSVLRDFGSPVPTPFIAGDGEISFQWGKDELRASAAFLSDGHIVAFSRTKTGQVPIAIDQPYKADLNLGSFLRSIQELT